MPPKIKIAFNDHDFGHNRDPDTMLLFFFFYFKKKKNDRPFLDKHDHQNKKSGFWLNFTNNSSKIIYK